MKPALIRKSEAFTLIELIFVVLVIFLIVLTAILFPPQNRRSAATRISCVNNLKQIGTAYRIWENDNGDLFPALQSVVKGGWSDFLTNANQGFLCWTNYAI